MTRYRFGISPVFELLVRERLLLANGAAVHLGSRALDVLVVLVEHAGQVVSRRDLIEYVWPQVAVDENNLSVQISALRKALGGQFIATIPGRGYSFTPRPETDPVPEVMEAPPRHKTNLPATLIPLIGRASELAELAQLVAAHRLVTILGPGGIGKTLLAQHLLRQHESRFRHGVCFVELSALPDTAAIPGAIAAALRIQPGSGAALDGLTGAIEPLEVLVVLDNAEHLLEGAAQVALALLDAAPGLKLVVTSQAPLKLAAERICRIGALSVPDAHLPAAQAMAHGAIALFVERARAADSRFVLTDEGAAAAIDLCRALDGLPLAIELAAWRAPVLGVRGLADSMHEPLKLLAAQNLQVPKRLQTLRNALEWSHSLLDAREQVVLRRLSILVGSSDLNLIQEVACDPAGTGGIDEWVVVDALTTLVERSLVVAVPGWKGGMRYRLLDTPRSFAKEQLTIAGELDAVGRRHAVAVAARFMQAHAQRFSGEVLLGEWQERHLPEIDNGHEALAWLRQHDEIELAVMLLPGLMHATPREERGKHAAMVALGAELATRVKPGPHALWTLLETSQLVMGSDPERGQAAAEAAVRLAEQLAPGFADSRWMFRALCQRALALLNQARTEAGSSCLAQARALERPTWPAVIRMQRWVTEVWLADRQADGEMMYQASLRFHHLSREAGLPGWASGLSMVNGALAGGRAEEAVQFGLAVVEQLDGTRHLGGLAETRVQLVGALVECGQLDEARTQSRLVWPLVARFSRIDVWADYQALLSALQGQTAIAALLLGFSNKICTARNIERTHNEAAAVRRTQGLLLSSLGQAEMNRWMAKGEGLLWEDIHDVAFGTAHRR